MLNIKSGNIAIPLSYKEGNKFLLWLLNGKIYV